MDAATADGVNKFSETRRAKADLFENVPDELKSRRQWVAGRKFAWPPHITKDERHSLFVSADAEIRPLGDRLRRRKAALERAAVEREVTTVLEQKKETLRRGWGEVPPWVFTSEEGTPLNMGNVRHRI